MLSASRPQLGALGRHAAFFQSLRVCMEDFYSVMTPREVLHLYASCCEAHALMVADAVAAAHFANSRWYSADASIGVWRSIWQQCVVAAQARGWNPAVWEHAEMLLEGTESFEFDDGSILLSSECDFHELSVPLPETRQRVVDGLEEYLAWKTYDKIGLPSLHKDGPRVLGILALFLFESQQTYYWSFMLAMDDNTFVSVQIDDCFADEPGMQCHIADTISALDDWRIDLGGRVLMCMTQTRHEDPVDASYLEDLDRVVVDAIGRKKLHKRQARDGTGYTWNEFLWWYVSPKLACDRWCEAPNIVTPMTLHQTDAPGGKHRTPLCLTPALTRVWAKCPAHNFFHE